MTLIQYHLCKISSQIIQWKFYLPMISLKWTFYNYILYGSIHCAKKVHCHYHLTKVSARINECIIFEHNELYNTINFTLYVSDREKAVLNCEKLLDLFISQKQLYFTVNTFLLASSSVSSYFICSSRVRVLRTSLVHAPYFQHVAAHCEALAF